jgi:transposase InsO family protein
MSRGSVEEDRTGSESFSDQQPGKTRDLTDEPMVPESVEGASGTSPAPATKSDWRRRAARAVPADPAAGGFTTPQQRLLVLDTWQRSGLPAVEFSALVQISPQTLYAWRRRFEAEGPAGLSDQPRGPHRGSRLAEATQRAILMLKQAHPEWGCERIHDVLLRAEGYGASPGAVRRVLRDAGYEMETVEARSHAEPVRRFERARPNQLWQSDLFTFLLRRENRRVYLVVFLDDHSRFVTGYGVHASASGALVREVLEAAVANFGAPEEVLTDNGPQYHTWRGKSAFTRLLERRGIRHLLSRPRHPQTLGKTERFWGTLWRECLERAVLRDLDEARVRIGHFVDDYNFHRPHQGIGSLVPADRYFEAAPEVRKTLEARVAANALELARDGVPRQSVYLTGRVGDETIALHGEGSRVILTRDGGVREEVELAAPGRRAAPGTAPALPAPVSAGAAADDGTERNVAEPMQKTPVAEPPAGGER